MPMPIEAAIIRQFAKPTGIFGRLVGFILANRSSNVRRGRWTVDLLELSSRDRVLEVGCGPGVALKACLKRLEQGTAAGLDHSDVMIDQARRRNARAVEMKRLRLIVGTIDDLPVDEWFDRIYSINLIQFIPDKPAFLNACMKRLAPNGMLAITFQPRGRKPTREAAFAMAKTLAETMASLAFIDVHTEVLEMSPIPAVCVLGRKAGLAP
jgi:ubiquinone/menaquinone biosynthesis C-methylase UbiE